MHRRDLLETAASLVVGGRMVPGPLATAVIPSTGEPIARVGLGTWQTFDLAPSAPVAQWDERAATIRVLLGAGATLIDTSPMYGHAEAALGRLLPGTDPEGKTFLATKVWTTGREAGLRQMEESAAKIGRARLDLIQIHNLVDWRTHLATLRRWKDQGRIRYLGITHYQQSAHDLLARAVKTETVDFVQINLSLDEPQATDRLLPLCRDRGVAVIANRPLGGGGALARVRGRPLPEWASEHQIGSWAQFLLKWVLADSAVTCVIPGTGNPRHLADNLDAARGTAVDGAARQRMTAYWRGL